MEKRWPSTDDVVEREQVRCRRCFSVEALDEAVSCSCHEYGYLGHEDSAWCSESCRDADHGLPEPDLDDLS